MSQAQFGFVWAVVVALVASDRAISSVDAADPPAVVVEPADLVKRTDLIGREVVVDDRIRFFLESRRGQGFDELVLKRTEVPFRLAAGSRLTRTPAEPNAVVRAVLKMVDGRLIGDVVTLELLPNDLDRLDREVARTRSDDFASKRTWALWAERRGRELNDPKLVTRGEVLEGEALWLEANRPGADAVVLADGSLNRPIPKVFRDALYQRGFRALEAQATNPDTLDDLAKRVQTAVPRATEPIAGLGPRPLNADPDPATAYRAAAADEQARMDRRLLTDIIEKSLHARLAANPSRATALADESARALPDRPAVAENLRQRGLAEAERGVATMRQAEVEELARTLRQNGQEDRARRAIEQWLGDRRQNRLSASDAEGRMLLAANYEKMLGDRATAGTLLNEAYTIDPESRSVADAFLRLGYRKGESGWFDPAAAKPAATTNPTPTTETRGDSLLGLTRLQARSKMGGKPDRIVRLATQGQIVEQWVYRAGRVDQVILFRIDSGTSEPHVTSSYSVPR